MAQRFSLPEMMDLTLVVVGYRVSEETGTALFNTEMEDTVHSNVLFFTMMFTRLFSLLSSPPSTKKKTAEYTEVGKVVSGYGQTINVIKTPGFYFMEDSRTIYEEELMRCINLARNLIHAFLLVVSVGTSYSKEEQDLFRILQKVFGEIVVNNIILVFTDGHLLETRGQSFAEYLDQGCPKPLKDIIRLCKDRCVLFDSKNSYDMGVMNKQAHNLLSKVNTLVRTNGYWIGNTLELIHQINKSSEERTTQRIHAVELRLTDTITWLEQQLEVTTVNVQERAEEYYKGETSELIRRLNESYQELMTQRLEEAEAARLKADERAQDAQKNSSEQIQKLKEAVERAEEAQKNSSEQIRKLKEADERAQEGQKNSSEQIQKLKEAVERAEKDRSRTRMSDTILEVGSTAVHVYDPSTYLLQSGMK